MIGDTKTYYGGKLMKKNHLYLLIGFSKVILVTKVDNKVISEEPIKEESFYGIFRINKEIPLKKDQVSTMTLVAIDELGLEHHYPLDHWVDGADMQSEPAFGREYIYSLEGKLLWKDENK